MGKYFIHNGNSTFLQSTNVGISAFNHLHFKSNVEYQTYLLRIIQRSQHPALLSAPLLSVVSLETFRKVRVITNYHYYVYLFKVFWYSDLFYSVLTMLGCGYGLVWMEFFTCSIDKLDPGGVE